MTALSRLPRLRLPAAVFLAVTALAATSPAQTETAEATETTSITPLQPPPPVVSGPLVEVRPGGLTAEQVAERALAASPTLAARRAEIDAASAQIAKTTARFFPRVTLSATYTRLSEANNSLGGSIVGARNPGPLALGPCDAADPAGPTCPVDSAGVPIGANTLAFPTTRNSHDLSAEVAVPLSDYVFTMPSAVGATRANARANEPGEQAAACDAAHEARVAYHDWLRAVAATSSIATACCRTETGTRSTSAASRWTT